MMVYMTETDETATEDRSHETGDRAPALRPAAYGETATSHTRTETATSPVPTRTGLVTRWTARRDLKRQTEQHHAANRQTAQQRDRATALAHAARIRDTTQTAARPETKQTVTADLPRWMVWTGLWLDRTLGSLPLVAPLGVSGYYTFHVGTQALRLPWLVALALTLALEGGVWKLARIYEETLVAGDSTIALRLGLGTYIAATGGLIFWHAHQANTNTTPAAVVSAMALAGLYIWARQARWARRVELRARGMVDTQAPKFSALSWLLMPVQTGKTMRHAVKYRITSPLLALADYRAWRASGKPKVWTPVQDESATETETGFGIDDQTGPDWTIPADWAPAAIETGPVDDPFETYGEPLDDVPVSPAPVSRPAPVRTAAPRQRSTTARSGETDPVVKYADYISAVQAAHPKWQTELFLPSRHDDALTVSKVMEATGLSGKQTACDVRKLLVQLATQSAN